MKSIDEYLAEFEISQSYVLDGEETGIEEFDGVAVPLEGGDEIFLEWEAYDEKDDWAILYELTPGMVRRMHIDRLEEKLKENEYRPVMYSEGEYKLPEIRDS